ncbi:unnamed protein product [Symbiodinium microadriaticum]|nr:unnamed protein product [Symbiodinium microadriaticum]CAE7944704.1 unnamed protein product [Symbiodinium sp. KB8]
MQDLCYPQYQVVALVAFGPKAASFRAHPIEWQQLQAQAAGVRFYQYEIDADAHDGDYKRAYRAAIQQLVQDTGISCLVTGDIDYVGSMTTNFITEVCEKHVPWCGVELPLWQQDREELLREMLSPEVDLDIRYTCVKSPHFDASWIGRRLDQHAVDEMRSKSQSGLDLSGENGEYHTMVVNGPMYRCGKGDGLAFDAVQPHELEQQRGQPSDQRWFVCDLERTILRQR